MILEVLWLSGQYTVYFLLEDLILGSPIKLFSFLLETCQP